MGLNGAIPNLNECPSISDARVRDSHHIVLMKDHKTICRTKACLPLPPFELCEKWSIQDRFLFCEKISGLPQFSLFPDPVDDFQRREWTLFTSFLQKNNKAAVVNSGSYTFFIRLPDRVKNVELSSIDHQGHPYAVVMYKPSDAHPHAVGMRNVMDTLPTVPEQIPGLVGNIAKGSSEIPTIVGRNTQPAAVSRNFVKTHPSYLRTLSQTHAGWIFGAIAELVDNARDANASRLDISIELLYSKKAGERIPVLSVVDDGHGMSHVDILRMISFGHEQSKNVDEDRIGRFGIGFKTGAMRLGRDAIVLTQSSSSRSVAMLSQSYNEDSENLEIPVVTYRKIGHYMEIDQSIQSECTADHNLNAIKVLSPFNEYFIGEKLGLFGESKTGTQIYIWNLDKWGSDYTLEWVHAKTVGSGMQAKGGDILIRSKRVRSRPGQMSRKVPLDYSLQSYLGVIFLNPWMKIFVQGSRVKTRPLAKSLNRTEVVQGAVMGKDILLTIGRSKVDYENMNCGMFIYWHGRLIEAYKRVGGQIHNADMGRGVVGVVDVTTLADGNDGNTWVLNSKQGFQDCEAYAELEEWLGDRSDEYWDKNFDSTSVTEVDKSYEPDRVYVQCDKCLKWRDLEPGFDAGTLPENWFCWMSPFNDKCETLQKPVGEGVVTVHTQRSRPKERGADALQKELDLEEDKSTFNVPSCETKKCVDVSKVTAPRTFKRLRNGRTRTSIKS